MKNFPKSPLLSVRASTQQCGSVSQYISQLVLRPRQIPRLLRRRIDPRRHLVICLIRRSQPCVVLLTTEQECVWEERVKGGSVVNRVDFFVRKLDAERVGDGFDVLDGLHANDGEDVC